MSLRPGLVFTTKIKLVMSIVIGKIRSGIRRIISIISGTIEGPSLSVRILSATLGEL